MTTDVKLFQKYVAKRTLGITFGLCHFEPENANQKAFRDSGVIELEVTGKPGIRN